MSQQGESGIATSQKRGPCGCGSTTTAMEGPMSMELSDDLPGLDELDGLLAEATSENLEGGELDLLGLEADLASAEDFPLTELGEDLPVNLNEVITLLERCPGLKVTLSF